MLQWLVHVRGTIICWRPAFRKKFGPAAFWCNGEWIWEGGPIVQNQKLSFKKIRFFRMTILHGVQYFARNNADMLKSNSANQSNSLEPKPTAAQLPKNFLTFHGTRRFITAMARARHWSLSRARLIQSILLSYFSKVHLNFSFIFSSLSIFWKNKVGSWDHVTVNLYETWYVHHGTRVHLNGLIKKIPPISLCVSPISLLGNGLVKVPLSLLGNGWVETLPRQRIHTQQ
jgi:hypothetical protein